MILKTGPAPHWFCDSSFGQSGGEFHQQYIAAKPFPHIVLDDFMDEELANSCLREFPERPSSLREYARKQENKKLEYNPEILSPSLRSLFHAFNSAPFIQFLQNMTGIKGLIPDPYFAGGGLHEVANGGHLSIHADFNHHTELDLERRINVLIYLNRDWKDEYGGCFEIWDPGMNQCSLRVAPLFNRCVVFSTSSTSFHGNPEPVNHPEGISRRSIALYYYTATWDKSRRERSTQFKVRPGSADQFDFGMRFEELAAEVTPPIAMRAFRKLIDSVRRRRAANIYG
jgi:Rps23 Pro-64 3,4-dihydroxylase Tpa1-like proline 4-hydroxylase